VVRHEIALLALSVLAAAPVTLVEEIGFRVDVQPVLVVGGESGALPARTFEIPPGEPGRLRLELQWPDPAATSVLELTATGRSEEPDGEISLELSAALRLPGGRMVRARRSLRQREGAAGLFEVYREQGQRLTLGVSAEREVRHVARAITSVGDPVVFRLDIDGVRGERTFELETNYLSTFVGEPVSYSFRRGEGDGEETVRVVLTPTSKTGELVEVLVEVSGSLPGEPSRLVLGRRETLVTSRGATSSVEVTTGDPPAGYRFRVRPEF